MANVRHVDTNCVYLADALDGLTQLPDHSVDLVLTDPPYNIGVMASKGGKKIKLDWDVIPNYVDWCIDWLTECQRVLKPNGILYFWHKDIAQIAQLLEAIKQRTCLALVSFCIWDKGQTYRAQAWRNRDPNGATALRSWFNTCEFCLHFFCAPKDADSAWRHTGLERINSSPECYKPLKEWHASEMERLGITAKDITKKYTEVTGRKPYMLQHYFRDTQFALPTRAVFESVYEPLGFDTSPLAADTGLHGYEGLRKSYEGLRKSYEGLRKSYEGLRNYHRCDANHCNVWRYPPVPSANRLHPCQKPTEILARIIRVSCPEGGIVLDPFVGSGSTAVACIDTGRQYIGFERDAKTYQVCQDRLAKHKERSQLTAKAKK